MADDVASYTAAGDEAWRASQFAKAGILDRRGDAAAAQDLQGFERQCENTRGAGSAYRVVESAFRAGDTARAEKLVLDFSDKERLMPSGWPSPSLCWAIFMCRRATCSRPGRPTRVSWTATPRR